MVSTCRFTAAFKAMFAVLRLLSYCNEFQLTLRLAHMEHESLEDTLPLQTGTSFVTSGV